MIFGFVRKDSPKEPFATFGKVFCVLVEIKANKNSIAIKCLIAASNINHFNLQISDPANKKHPNP